jgi:hypothetical protein
MYSRIDMSKADFAKVRIFVRAAAVAAAAAAAAAWLLICTATFWARQDSRR